MCVTQGRGKGESECLIFSYIRILVPFWGVQNFEFHFFQKKLVCSFFFFFFLGGGGGGGGVGK